MGLQDTISKVPTWGWAAGGVILIGLVFLMTKGSGGQAATSPAVPAADVNDILAQLQNAADLVGSKTPTTPTTPTTPAPGVKTLTGYVAKITGKASLYYSSGKPTGVEVSGITVNVKKRIKVGGRWLYQITSGKYKGRYLSVDRDIKYTPIYSILPAPTTTTQSSSTVPTGNNQVSG